MQSAATGANASAAAKVITQRPASDQQNTISLSGALWQPLAPHLPCVWQVLACFCTVGFQAQPDGAEEGDEGDGPQQSEEALLFCIGHQSSYPSFVFDSVFYTIISG